MSKKPWSEIFADSCVLTGNVAKVKVLEKLKDHIANASGVEILDIGCVGPQPLELWVPLLIQESLQFHLTGIDVGGAISRKRCCAGSSPSMKAVNAITFTGYGRC